MARSALLLAIVVGLMGVTGQSFAKRINAEKEWRQGDNPKLLPTYCQDRLDPNGRWVPWRNYFGNVSIHIHHYCGGLYAEFKARIAPNPRERKQWLQAVVGEMGYVAGKCDATCVLYVDVHRKMAEALNQLGRFDEAMKHVRLLNAAPRTAPTPNVAPPETPRVAPPS